MYDISSPNPIAQAYAHLKTLPEFSDASAWVLALTNVGVGGEAMGAKHFVLTVSQEVCHPKPSIFV